MYPINHDFKMRMYYFGGINLKKDILIIDTPYVNLSGNNRSNYIPTLLIKNGYKVEKVSSNFNHQTKEHIYTVEKEIPFKVTLIETNGYKKNVSLKRFISQKSYARNLNKYLKSRKKPDVIYNFIPSLDVGSVVRKYAKKNNIKLIIDIRDLWPEAFNLVIKVPWISKMLFFSQTIKANKIYAYADEIIAVSDTYRDKALKVNKKLSIGHTIFLGTDLDDFDKYVLSTNECEVNSKNIKLAYVGTLGHSYDLITTFDSIKILDDKGYKNIEIFIFGSGPLEEKYKHYAKKLNLNVRFFGRLVYSKMVPILVQCDIALNPISKGAAQSIINKHADYAAAGLPVINTQESKEYRKLVEDNKVGFNVKPNDSLDMAKKIEILINSKNMRKEFGENHRKLAENKFDRSKTYYKIVELIK